VDDLIRKLSALEKTKASKKLMEFYATTRFGLDESDFSRQYTDGENDGGIDFFHEEGPNFYIFQSKFSGKPQKASEKDILHEIDKINKTLTKGNPNKKAEDFVNHLKQGVCDTSGLLEIIWLTTNIVDVSLRETIKQKLRDIKDANDWTIGVDFVAIDKNDLEGIVFDFIHGYIPQTGKRTIQIENGDWIEIGEEEAGPRAVVCIVNANSILEWFKSRDDVETFLQKNVRGLVSEKGINKEIANSYDKSPAWFWYKHNGIIIFADYMHIDEERRILELRNPQIVNGGQTVRVLYEAYNRRGRTENSAKVLLRVYRLPYDNAETYKTSIDIIEALNSQNRILSSDLRANDPRQVRLERLFRQNGYTYFRRRFVGLRSGRLSIPMWKLAPLYYCCKRQAPHASVAMYVQELFRDDSKYTYIFNPSEIGADMSGSHVLLRYITVWNLHDRLRERRKDLPKRDDEFFEYTQYFVLADLYNKLMDWKTRQWRGLTWKNWMEFVESDELASGLWSYVRFAFSVGSDVIPKDEEPRSFFRSKDSSKRFFSRTSPRKFQKCVNTSFRKFQNLNQ